MLAGRNRGVARAAEATRYLLRAKSTKTSNAVPFADEADATIKEQTLFNEVFNRMIQKDRENSTNDYIGPGPGLQAKNTMPSYQNVQVVFDKASSDNKVSSMDSDSLHNNPRYQAPRTGDSANMTTEDVRKYPISLPQSYFSQNDAYRSSELGPTHTKNKMLTQGLPSQQQLLFKGVGSSGLAEFKKKENFKILVDEALGPHVKYLTEHIRTDKDILAQLNVYFDQFEKRDTSKEKFTDDSITAIKEHCESVPSQLPQPYSVTFPAIIRILLTSSSFNISDTRKYIILSNVYYRCKGSKDVSLYIQACNTDFYNILLRSSWENFKQIHLIKKLVKEMHVNGVVGDIFTVEVLNDIINSTRAMTEHIPDENSSTDTNLGLHWCTEVASDIEALQQYLETLETGLA